MSDKNEIDRIANAIEDLLYMGAIRMENSSRDDKLSLSPQLSLIISNLMSNSDLKGSNDRELQTMKTIYYSLLIYFNEYLKLPRQLTMAFGNDLEKFKDDLQCSDLISLYVSVVLKIFSEELKRSDNGKK